MAAVNLKPPVMAGRYSHTTHINVIFNYVNISEQSLNTNEPQLYAYFLLPIYYLFFSKLGAESDPDNAGPKLHFL